MKTKRQEQLEGKNKELAYPVFRKKMEESWTYSRLSDQEKINLDKVFEMTPIRGNYLDRMEILACIYNAFLFGAGYIDDLL